jgi:hypothetical protein
LVSRRRPLLSTFTYNNVDVFWSAGGGQYITAFEKEFGEDMSDTSDIGGEGEGDDDDADEEVASDNDDKGGDGDGDASWAERWEQEQWWGSTS